MDSLRTPQQRLTVCAPQRWHQFLMPSVLVCALLTVRLCSAQVPDATGRPVIGVEQADSPITTNNYLPAESLPVPLVPNVVPLAAAPEPWWMSEQQQSLGLYPMTYQWTLHDVLAAAVDNSPEVELLRIDVATVEQDVLIESAKFDWKNFLESRWDDRSDPVGSSLAGAQNRVRNDKYTGRGGLKRQNALGGNFEVSQRIGHENSNSSFFDPKNQGSATFGITYAQPLLREGGRAFNRASIELALTDARATDATYVQGLQQHLVAVANAYWNLWQQRCATRVYLRSWKRGDDLVQVMRARQSIDIGPIQLLRASSAATQRYNQYALAQREVLKAQEQLLRLVFGANYPRYAQFEHIPVTVPMVEAFPEDNQHVIQTALAYRPEIHASLASIQRAAIEQGIAKNNLLPLLSMTLDVSNSGLRGSSEIGQAWVDQFSVGEPTYAIGLNYERPVGNRAAIASMQKSQLRLKRFQVEFDQVVSDVTLDASQAVFSASASRIDLTTKTAAWRLTTDEYDGVEKRFELLVDGTEVGRLYLENLLQTQDRLAGAEVGAITAQSQMEQQRINVYRAAGTFLQKDPAMVPPSNH